MTDPSLDFYEQDQRDHPDLEETERAHALADRLAEYAPFAELVRPPLMNGARAVTAAGRPDHEE